MSTTFNRFYVHTVHHFHGRFATRQSWDNVLSVQSLLQAIKFQIGSNLNQKFGSGIFCREGGRVLIATSQTSAPTDHLTVIKLYRLLELSILYRRYDSLLWNRNIRNIQNTLKILLIENRFNRDIPSTRWTKLGSHRVVLYIKFNEKRTCQTKI